MGGAAYAAGRHGGRRAAEADQAEEQGYYQEAPPAPPAPAPTEQTQVDQLKQLADLHAAGTLTDD